jgi:hypothetical protein
MSTKTEEAIEDLKSSLTEDDFNRMLTFTLSDAIRMGSSVTEQSYDWGDGNTACALSAAAIAAKAVGYI